VLSEIIDIDIHFYLRTILMLTNLFFTFIKYQTVMHKESIVFAGLFQFMNRSKFNRIVVMYSGDKYVNSFHFWDLLFTMMFGQLTNRKILRDLIVATEAHS